MNTLLADTLESKQLRSHSRQMNHEADGTEKMDATLDALTHAHHFHKSLMERLALAITDADLEGFDKRLATLKKFTASPHYPLLLSGSNQLLNNDDSSFNTPLSFLKPLIACCRLLHDQRQFHPISGTPLAQYFIQAIFDYLHPQLTPEFTLFTAREQTQFFETLIYSHDLFQHSLFQSPTMSDDRINPFEEALNFLLTQPLCSHSITSSFSILASAFLQNATLPMMTSLLENHHTFVSKDPYHEGSLAQLLITITSHSSQGCPKANPLAILEALRHYLPEMSDLHYLSATRNILEKHFNLAPQDPFCFFPLIKAFEEQATLESTLTSIVKKRSVAL